MTDNIEREKFIEWHMKEHASPRALARRNWDHGLGSAKGWQARAALSQSAASGIDELHEFVLFVAGQPHYPLPFPDDGIDRLGSLQSRYTNIVLKAEKLSSAKDKNDAR